MKKLLLMVSVFSLFATTAMQAQDEIVVVDESVAISEVPCNTNYYTTRNSNWFLEIGAGIDLPIVENDFGGDDKGHITTSYGVGFGKWFSPYFAWRIEAFGGSAHYNINHTGMGHAKLVSGNVDIMWDMFNTIGGVNSDRVFSIVPFVGLGYSYLWDYRPKDFGNVDASGRPRRNESLFPVSAGLQFRFRLSDYVDFFVQGRAQFYSDCFNNYAQGRPVDINITALGGFTFNFGGSNFRSYNPCDYIAYINSLNNQVNDLRGELAVTTAALAAANAQLPCPEVSETVVVEETIAPLLATVRFTINSDRITNEEKLNVYNIAEWLKANPEQNIIITGYADKDTGTSGYNMKLSERRAQAVANMLIKEYNINPDRIVMAAEGSNVQPYPVNNWNRVVIFSAE